MSRHKAAEDHTVDEKKSPSIGWNSHSPFNSWVYYVYFGKQDSTLQLGRPSQPETTFVGL